MKMTFGDLWRSAGTIDRGTYALVGVLGFALKHNLDRLVATYGFHRPWGLFNYWVPVRDVAKITDLTCAAVKPGFWRRWWRCRCRLSGWAWC